MKLLILKPSSLGDILHTFPAAAMLRQALPDAELSWVANDSLAQIVQLFPGLHRILPFPRREIGRCNLKAIHAFIRLLREETYDAILDFQGLLRTGLVCLFARRAPRYGFAHAREGAPLFYSRRIAVPLELRHAVDKNCFLARAFLRDLGLEAPEGVPEAPLQLPQAWQEDARRLLDERLPGDGPLLAVGCSSRWESKSWSTEFFGDTLAEVRRRRPDARIWLLGSPGERERAEAVRIRAGLPPECDFAGGTDLGALTALLARSRVLFTNDSGPMHIAAALGTPCVACFGATDPTLTGPYGPPGRHTVLRSPCPQSPCRQRICPLHPPCCATPPPATAADAIAERLA